MLIQQVNLSFMFLQFLPCAFKGILIRCYLGLIPLLNISPKYRICRRHFPLAETFPRKFPDISETLKVSRHFHCVPTFCQCVPTFYNMSACWGFLRFFYLCNKYAYYCAERRISTARVGGMCPSVHLSRTQCRFVHQSWQGLQTQYEI